MHGGLSTSKKLYPHDVLALFREMPGNVAQMVSRKTGVRTDLRFETFYKPEAIEAIEPTRRFLHHAVAFDFTGVDPNAGPIKHSSDYAVQAIEDGTFRLPFPIVGLMNTVRVTRAGKMPHPLHGFSLWLQSKDEPPSVVIFMTVGDTYETYAIVPEATLRFTGGESGFWHPWVNPKHPAFDMEHKEEAAYTVNAGLAYLSMLRWKATRKVFTPAPDKVNLKRAKSGKPLINKRYTIIIEPGHQGVTAGPQQGGTHASPIPHWRRGHDRTLKSGLIVPVRESRVGYDENKVWDVAHKKYEVRT